MSSTSIVLDIGLPGLDGFEVLRQMRAQGSSLPVIVLTARDQVQQKVSALDSGADDYLTKPFDLDELLAPVRATYPSRRPALVLQGGRGGVGDARWNSDSRTGSGGGERQGGRPSSREFALLGEYFMSHPGQVLSRQQMLSAVWDYDFDPGSNVVDVYVRYLRKKFGAAAITHRARHGLPVHRLNCRVT